MVSKVKERANHEKLVFARGFQRLRQRSKELSTDSISKATNLNHTYSALTLNKTTNPVSRTPSKQSLQKDLTTREKCNRLPAILASYWLKLEGHYFNAWASLVKGEGKHEIPTIHDSKSPFAVSFFENHAEETNFGVSGIDHNHVTLQKNCDEWKTSSDPISFSVPVLPVEYVQDEEWREWGTSLSIPEIPSNPAESFEFQPKKPQMGVQD